MNSGSVAALWVALVCIVAAALVLAFQLGVSWGAYPWASRRAFLRHCLPEVLLTAFLTVGALALTLLLGVR